MGGWRKLLVVTGLWLLLLPGCGGSGGSDSLVTALPDKTVDSGGTPVPPPSGGENPPPVEPQQPEPGMLGELIDLGDLLAPDGNPPPGDGWYFTKAVAINDNGTVIGQSNSGRIARAAFVWDTASKMTFLETTVNDGIPVCGIPGTVIPLIYSEAVDLNNSGEIVGNSTTGIGWPTEAVEEKRAFIYQDGIAFDLTPLVPEIEIEGKVYSAFSTQAVDINERGDVAITAVMYNENCKKVKIALLWNGASFDFFHQIVGAGAEAVAINENGQGVVNSGGTAVFTDFNWGVGESLNHLPGKIKTVAVDINDSIYTNHDDITDGHIIGNSGNGNLKIEEDGDVQGFFWDGGAMYPIGHFGGGTSVATDVNNKDQVVGGAKTADGSIHAYIWTLDANKKGIILDLGTLGGNNSFATAINDAGQVIGWSETGEFYEEQGVRVPIRHAFLWQNGVMYDLGTHDDFYDFPFTPPYPFSEATAISERGQVIGNSLTINVHSRGFTLTPAFP